MKRGGIKDRDDKSSGMEILMTETFVNINPTNPLIPPVYRELEPMLHDFRWVCLLWIDEAQANIKPIYECRCNERL